MKINCLPLAAHGQLDNVAKETWDGAKPCCSPGECCVAKMNNNMLKVCIDLEDVIGRNSTLIFFFCKQDKVNCLLLLQKKGGQLITAFRMPVGW